MQIYLVAAKNNLLCFWTKFVLYLFYRLLMEWSDLGKYDGNMNHTQSGEQDILECKGWNALISITEGEVVLWLLLW